MWVRCMTEAEDMTFTGTTDITTTGAEEDMTVAGTADMTTTGEEEDMIVNGTAAITMTGIENTTKKVTSCFST